VALNLLCDAFEAMEDARSASELRIAMERFTKQMGFDHFAYALTINAPSLKPQQFFLSDYPQRWIDHYLSQGYFRVDPLVRHCERSTLPALWDGEELHDVQAQGFWEEAQSHGLTGGLSFAAHEQCGVTGIFSLSRDKVLDLDGQDLAALIGRAQMFASLLHHAVVRMDLPKLLPADGGRLTPRERECLKWAADGKTAWEIGQILGISERTAVFHINNVIQKLGAANKTQAIVRAVALRLL
jgi:LuxR family transcriptional regulator, quorum-sensing system regulator SolR